MRQVVLDTETTGLEWRQGHRIIEIGAVELLNRRLTGRDFHVYLNPEREIDRGAAAVHGITLEQLRDAPRFVQIAADLLDFLGDAELVIHNAPFDLGFLNNELAQVGFPPLGQRVLDTLAEARRLHPGQKNDLDSLCRRYNVDNSAREKHGALLDCQILAGVYLAMTGGQVDLALDSVTGAPAPAMETPHVGERPRLKVLAPSPEEQAAHAAYLKKMAKGGSCLWLDEEPS